MKTLDAVRWRRWARRLARGLGWLLAGVVGFVVLVGIGINLPWARSRLARELSQRVSESIAGSVTVTSIGRIGFGSVAGIDAVLADASGRRVAELEGGSADLDLTVLLRSWVRGDTLTIAFERIAVRRLDVRLIEDAEGELSIAAALEPAEPPGPEPPAGGGPAPDWRFEDISLEEALVAYDPAEGTELEVRLLQLAGSVQKDASALGFELRRVTLGAAPLPVVRELEATLSASGRLELGASTEALEGLLVEVEISGSAAEIPFEARAVHAGGKVMGYLDADAAPRSVERLWPDAAVDDAIHLYVGFEGSLDRIQILCVLESDGGDLFARGHLGIAPHLSGELSLVALHFDASQWIASAPETSLKLAAELGFALEPGGLEARAAVRTWDSRYGALELPPLELSARFERDALEADARFELAGARAELRAEMPLAGPKGQRRLSLAIAANITDLTRLAQALGESVPLTGRARLEGSGTIELGTEPRIAGARLTAVLRDISAGPVRVARASLTATARGAAISPALELFVRARNVAVPGYPLRSVELRAHGDLTRARLQAEIDPARASPMRLSASVAPVAKTLRGLSLVMAGDENDEARLEVTAERLTLTESELEVLDLVVDGPGRLELDGSFGGGRAHAAGSAIRFSPAALSRRLGLELEVPEGLADMTFRGVYRRSHMSGSLAGTLTEVAIAGTTGRAAADLVLEDNVVNGVVEVCFPSLVDARVEAASLRLPAQPSARALTRVSGTLEAHVRADLARLSQLPLLSGFPVPSRGEVQANAIITEGTGSFPEVRVAVATHELAWMPSILAKSGVADSAPAWRALDVELTGSLASSRVRLAAALLDSEGESIATLTAGSRVDLERLWTRPQTFDVRELPLEVDLRVAERALEDLPLPGRLERLQGRASARLRASGTLGRPSVNARVVLAGLNLERSRQAPLDFVADATLEGRRLRAEASVRSERQKLLSLHADAEVSGGGQPPRIERLDLDVRGNGLPLAPFGVLAGLDLSGDLYGSLDVKNLATTPELHGTLWINRLELDGFRQRQARWTVAADSASFRTRLELRQARGRAELSASGPWSWRELSAPALQPSLARGSLVADGFSLGGLQALIPEQIRELRGRLDAELFIEPSETQKSRGYVQLREGAAYVAALGQEFRDISLDARLDAGGSLRIESLRARALQGRLSARGSAKLDGFAFHSAELAVQIPRGDPMPLMLEGVTMADAWGNLELQAGLEQVADSRRLNIDVRIPMLQVSLPRQAPPDVQELEADPTVVAGTYQADGNFISLPLPPYEARDAERTDAAAAPLTTRIQITLGDRVWLERGAQLEVKLDGSVVFDVGDEPVARGELRIERGQIDVQGRIFEIESGVITFVDEREPSNPTVVATARYTAPEGTEVYAEFVGPVETGKLSLRSEPPLRDDQILSLLLFGTTDGNFGAASGDGSVSGVALAAGGSVVTQGLNQELRRLTTLDIQTRIGEREGAPQPEIAVQISPRLTAELAYSLSTPTPGRSQDRTYLTLDLRLFRNWSLSTTIGDAGSLLLDLLWRLRY